jgi:hypothetical protein
MASAAKTVKAKICQRNVNNNNNGVMKIMANNNRKK